MCRFGTWIIYSTLLLTCGFSQKVVTLRNVIIPLELLYKTKLDNNVSNNSDLSNMNNRIIVDLLKVRKSTLIPQRSHSRIDSISTKPIVKSDYFRNYKWTLPPPVQDYEDRSSDYNGEDQCNDNYECRKYLKYSICDRRSTGNVCRCISGIHDGLECLSRDGYCKKSIQCPLHSICSRGSCACKHDYIRKEFECVSKNSDAPTLLTALIAGVFFLIVISCLFVVIMALKRKLRQRRDQLPDENVPTISSMIDARRPILPDPSYQRIDKPPTYEEATVSSTLPPSLSVHNITTEPPTYSQIQQEGRNGNPD